MRAASADHGARVDSSSSAGGWRSCHEAMHVPSQRARAPLKYAHSRLPAGALLSLSCVRHAQRSEDRRRRAGRRLKLWVVLSRAHESVAEMAQARRGARRALAHGVRGDGGALPQGRSDRGRGEPARAPAQRKPHLRDRQARGAGADQTTVLRNRQAPKYLQLTTQGARSCGRSGPVTRP